MTSTEKYPTFPVSNPYATGGRTLSDNQKKVMGAFRFVAFVVGILAAIYMYNNEESDWGLAVLTFFVVAGFVGGGLGPVFTHDKKVQRTLYFGLITASQVGVAYGTHEWWDRWWLSAVLGLIVGSLIGMLVASLIFRPIAREQMEEAQQAKL